MSFSPDPTIVAVGFGRLSAAESLGRSGRGRFADAPVRQVNTWPDTYSDENPAVKSTNSSISNF